MKSSEKMKVFRVASSLSIVNNMKSISARGSNRDLVAYQAAQAKKEAAKKQRQEILKELDQLEKEEIQKAK